MARKVTPLYAETLNLLKLWSLDETPASKSKFISSGTKAYTVALRSLVEDGALSETPKNKRTNVYSLTESGEKRLAAGLANSEFAFSSVAGPKTTNALLKWFRQRQTPITAARSVSNTGNPSNGNTPQIGSYEAFAETALKTYDQLNQDYNLGDLVPIYRIRRELGDRVPRQQFNEWLLEIQANDIVQLMGGDLPNATSDQLEDSVAIPGGGTRFYVKRLQPT
ncbi:MAG: hypothetical protein AAFQ63_05430 [Cyanobacteria bacterium J06621_11]